MRLVAKNVELFKQALKDATPPEETVPDKYAWLLKWTEKVLGPIPKDPELTWNEIEGSFHIGAIAWAKWASCDHAEGLGTAEAMQEVWSECFDKTAVEHYDRIETDLWHEKQHGLS